MIGDEGGEVLQMSRSDPVIPKFQQDFCFEKGQGVDPVGNKNEIK